MPHQIENFEYQIPNFGIIPNIEYFKFEIVSKFDIKYSIFTINYLTQYSPNIYIV